MKLSISNIAWDPRYNEQVYRTMRENGFGGLEIAPAKLLSDFPRIDKHDIETFKVAMCENEFELPSMQSVLYGTTGLFLFQGEESRSKLLEHMKLCVDLCRELQCRNIVFGSPKNRIYSDYESDYRIALEFFTELGNYGAQKNVMISIEPNPALYGGNFLLNSQDTYEFVTRVDNPNVAMQIDLGAMIANQEPVADIETYMDKVVHVHLSRPGLKFYECPEYDIPLFQMLEKLGYEGHVSIEMLSSDIDEVERAITCIRDIEKKPHDNR